MKNQQNDNYHHAPVYIDTERQARLRRRLVDGIADKGITDARVLNALNELPRHFFMPAGMEDKAYIDKAFPIGEGQTG